MGPGSGPRDRQKQLLVRYLLLAAVLAAVPSMNAGGQIGGRLVDAPAGGAYERSVLLARKAAARHPGNANVLYVLGHLHFRHGRFTDAALVFGDVLKLAPSHFDGLLGLAEAHRKLGHHEAALEAYARLLVAAPPAIQVKARRGMADIHYRSEKYRLAIECLSPIAATNDPEALFHLGQALDAESLKLKASGAARAEVEKVDREALSVLERAVKADPSQARAHHIMASIYRRLGNTDSARKHVEEHVKRKLDGRSVTIADFENSEVVFEAGATLRLARALLGAGDSEGALDLVLRSLEQKPDFVEARAFHAWILFKGNRVEEAARIYRSILASDPTHAEALWNLGKIHVKRQELLTAAPLLLRATELKKSFPEGWELLTQIARKGGIFSERLVEFATNAVRTRPSASNYSILALVLFEIGDKDASLAALVEGLKKHPRDPELQEALQAMQAAGKAAQRRQ